MTSDTNRWAAIDDTVRGVLAAGDRVQARGILAKAQADALAESEPEQAAYFCSFRAALYYADSQDDVAIRTMREAISLAPELPYHRVALARFLARTIEVEAALNELSIAEIAVAESSDWTYLLTEIQEIRQKLAAGEAV
jgi:hypothetical protein